MPYDFENMLEKYAELIVRVGLNLQPGQRLLMVDPSRNHGIPISLSPLVRHVARKAYQAGADFVDVIWSDEELKLIRFQEARRDTFHIFPDWLPNALLEYVKRGDAFLSIFAVDPDLLTGQDADLIGIAQKTIHTKLEPVQDYIHRNATNWSLVSAPVSGWAKKVFPDLDKGEQLTRLWETIFKLVRLETSDPIAVWEAHIADLAARCDYFNYKRYRAFHYLGPGTNLTVGLPDLQCWRGGQITSEKGIHFVPNLPTEEVFTQPDRERVEGYVHATKPLSYGGQIIEDFALRFSQGCVQSFSARKGESVLRKLLETDEGASRLGEVALVPHSSPVSESGLMFHNGLYDENAASHFAFGSAYKFTLQGGESMTDEQFVAVGGNVSIAHVDFMVGSGQIDVDGIRQDGSTEPVMRSGEWAFGI